MGSHPGRGDFLIPVRMGVLQILKGVWNNDLRAHKPGIAGGFCLFSRPSPARFYHATHTCLKKLL